MSKLCRHIVNVIVVIVLGKLLYQVSILLAVFLPFLIYAIACIFYFTIYSTRNTQNAINNDSEPEGWFEYSMKVLVYSLTLYMASFELFQMIDKKWKYLGELSNWVDQISSLLIIGMVIKNDFYSEQWYDLKT